MDQGVRVMLSLGIVAGGAVLALLFRPTLSPTDGSLRDARHPLVLRGTTAPAPATPVSPPAPRPAMVVTQPAPVPHALPPASLDTHDPPPRLARSYPELPLRPGSHQETARGIGLLGPTYEPPQQRTHTIVDGDTLPALAERYLGSVDRAPDLFAANRYLLTDPEVLPIGAKLEIPPHRPEPPMAASALTTPPLVPVRPRP